MARAAPSPDSTQGQSLEFYVRDDAGTENGGVDQSATATVSVSVTPVNDRPVAYPQSVVTLEDADQLVALDGDDGDPE